MSIPWSAVIAAGLGVAAGVRALYLPNRAITRRGYVRSCATTSGCDASMVIDTGGGPVYSVTAGTVIFGGAQLVAVAADLEDVLLMYDWRGSDTNASDLKMAQSSFVSPGSHVSAGKQIGTGGLVRFSVQKLIRSPSGVSFGGSYEPASWLAVRGLKVSEKATPGSGQWCEGGRNLSVPQSVAKCGLELPAPSSWSLLPVQVSLR